MAYCSNCGQQLSEDGGVCPHCGRYHAAPPVERSPGSAWGLGVLGFLIAIASAVTGIGPVVVMIVYFAIKDRQPELARGMGYGLLTVVALILGAVALCFILIFNGLGKAH